MLWEQINSFADEVRAMEVKNEQLQGDIGRLQTQNTLTPQQDELLRLVGIMVEINEVRFDTLPDLYQEISKQYRKIYPKEVRSDGPVTE